MMRRPSDRAFTPATRLALLAVCVLAVFFRTYRMEPPGLWGDDAINALLAFDVIDGKVSSPFQLVAHAHSHFHALSNYPIAAAFWAFGADLSTMRIPGIIAGILVVPLLYGTVAPLFGARVALVSALFFATSPVQIAHSKFLIQIVLGEFFQLLGLCLIVRGVTGRRPWFFSAAAVPFAFCLYTYHAAKLAPLVVLPFLVAALGCQRLRHRLAWPGIVGVILFLLFLTPAVQSYSRDPGALIGRWGGTWLWSTLSQEGSLWPLWDAVWRTLMIFHYQQGPTYHWFGLGFDPAVNIVIAFLLVHGFVVSLRHWREPRHLLLLTWVVLGLVPGVLSTDAPRMYRIVLATPALYVWAALPVVRLAGYVAFSGLDRRILQGVAALLIVAVPLLDFNYYFHRVYKHPDFRWFQGERVVEMARTLKQFGPDWTGYLLAEDFSASHETLQFLSRAWGIRIHNVASLADVLPIRELPAGGVLFMMTRRTLGAAAAIANMYPTGELLLRDDARTQSQWFDNWWSVPVHQTTRDNTIAFFPVSQEAANGIHGITTTFLEADGRRLGVQVDSQPRLDEALGIANRTISAVRVSWSGGLFAPADDAYRFVLQANVAAQVWIDGLELVSSQHPTATWHLAEGLHQFDAAAVLSSQPELQLVWQPAGKNQEVIPQSQFFTRAPNGLLAAYSLRDQRLLRIEP